MKALNEGIWILPIRERAAGVETLNESIKWADPLARVVAIFDDDDPELEQCRAAADPRWLRIVMPEGHSTAAKINYAVSLYPNEKFYGLLANDIEVRAPGTLSLLAAACPDYGLSYCSDSIHDKALATHPCVGGALVKAIGYWAYPKAKHTGIDVYLTNLAYEFDGCVYVNGGKFWHKHYTHERAPFDAVYQRAKDYAAADRAASESWLREGQSAAQRAIRKARG